jgi:O-antigen/teichoic acid export membrane protein
MIVFPLCLLIGFMGPNLLAVIGKTNQWVGGGTALSILCVAACLRCIDQFFPQLFAAAGRTTFSIIESSLSTVVFCGLIFLGLYLFGDDIGILAVCAAWVLGYVIIFVPLWMMTTRIVPLTLWRFLVSSFKNAVLGTSITAVALTGALFALARFDLQPLPQLLVLGAIGVPVYLAWLRLGLGIDPRSFFRIKKDHGTA